jgi:predicted acylesterase/phospholipase RssA
MINIILWFFLKVNSSIEYLIYRIKNKLKISDSVKFPKKNKYHRPLCFAKDRKNFQKDLSYSKTYLISLITNKYKYLDINNLGLENRDKFFSFFQELNEEFEFIEKNLSIGYDNLYSSLEYFQNVKLLFGSTALMLSGGGSMGTYHIGVMKCLNDNAMMPRIVCGSSSGAIMASIACTKDSCERSEALKLESIEINMLGEKDNTMNPFVIFFRRLRRFLTKGVVFDFEVLEEAMKQNLGSVTFLEAFEKTGNILNISISFGSSYEMPKILNHVTAPNVLIWSAVVVSCSVPKFFEPCSLFCKNSNGEIGPWFIHSEDEKWLDGSVENDIPGEVMRIFFGANNLIVSQVNPHIYPFVLLNGKSGLFSDIVKLIFRFISKEFDFRIGQMVKFIKIPKFLQIIWFVLKQKYMGNVNIIHSLSLVDYFTMFYPCTHSYIQHSIDKGEKATEGFLESLGELSRFEQKLDNTILKLKKEIEERKAEKT